MTYLRSASLCLLVLLAACSTAKVEDYKENCPALDIRDYFKGNTEARGVFIDRSNKADPSFYAKLKGSWPTASAGTLEEWFTYSDGRKQTRKWELHMTDEHHFTGTAKDVIGVAQGTQYGNAVNMKYVLAVPNSKGEVYNITMDDWLYRLDEHTVINHVQMTKYGFKVGELIITFHKK